MKRSTVIAALFSVGILVLLVVFEAFAASPPGTNRDKVSIKFHHEIGNMPKAIRSGDTAALAACQAAKIAPVFDATGAVVSDPSGTVWILNQSGVVAGPVCPGVKITPVSNPTGTIMKIAPVFDATGAIVSDPTGTILNGINP